MKKIIFTLLLIASIFVVRAQEEKNIADLDFLYQTIQKMPSYKDQVKNSVAYKELYESVRKDLKTDDEFEVYQRLMKLIFPIRDNHLGLWRKADSSFRFIPKQLTADLSILGKKYADYPIDSIEGIYHSGNLTYILYETQPKTYHLINQADGTLISMFIKNDFGSYEMIKFLKPPNTYVLERSLQFQNGLLIGTPYYKGKGKNFYNVLERKKNYEYKVLESEIGYLSLGTFSSKDQVVTEATAFFNGVKQTINVKKLIVDVRNNSGGYFKNSQQFIDFIKAFKGEVYILQNGFTVSNAEQFIIRLKERKNVITLGEKTKGTISYGSNYGKHITLPSGRFVFYPTDLGGSKQDLPFESVGIKPDISLKYDDDWIAQTLKYIKAN